MYYYEVAPADNSYQGSNYLTYKHSQQLKDGQLVVVNLRTKTAPGIIIKSAKKPDFPSKDIAEIYEDAVLPEHQLELMTWLTQYYPAPLGQIAQTFLPKIKQVKKSDSQLDVKTSSIKSTKIELTSDQDRTIKAILDSSKRVHIVHGDTGSGKTQVYIELAKHYIGQNKSIIILTPEIGLTPQLFEQLSSHFKNITVVHSGLTEVERRKISKSILSSPNTPRLVVGPRSALFQPINNLGLIVIDEFQDTSYKQDSSPRYNAIQVAAMLSKIVDGKLVLGSATPPVEEFFYARNKGAKIHRMTQKPLSFNSSVDIEIVNLSDKNQNSPYPLLSKKLLSSLSNNLDKGVQSLVYINKRGTSRLIICQNCGWSAHCERCNIPYTYHHDIHLLICHICNRRQSMPNECPSCGSANIILKKPGTKAIFESLNKLFPDAKIGRYDKDNKKNETFYINQKSIALGKVDILIGTQLLAKGHDLPRLGLVAILMTEDGLNFPDYKSHEKNYILTQQLIGRVGRREKNGKVIVQTFSDSSAINDYLDQKPDAWINFYNKELKQRKKYKYPPFCFILKINIARKSEASSEKFAQKIVDLIRHVSPKDIEVLGPSPAYIYKQSDKYIWQIIVKSTERSTLLKIVKMLPKGCSFNIDPDNLL